MKNLLLGLVAVFAIVSGAQRAEAEAVKQYGCDVFKSIASPPSNFTSAQSLAYIQGACAGTTEFGAYQGYKLLGINPDGTLSIECWYLCDETTEVDHQSSFKYDGTSTTPQG